MHKFGREAEVMTTDQVEQLAAALEAMATEVRCRPPNLFEFDTGVHVVEIKLSGTFRKYAQDERARWMLDLRWNSLSPRSAS